MGDEVVGACVGRGAVGLVQAVRGNKLVSNASQLRWCCQLLRESMGRGSDRITALMVAGDKVDFPRALASAHPATRRLGLRQERVSPHEGSDHL